MQMQTKMWVNERIVCSSLVRKSKMQSAYEGAAGISELSLKEFGYLESEIYMG